MPRALLLVADGFHDRDIHDVAALLHAQGWETRTCGPQRGATYTGAGGRTVVADLGYMNVNVDAYDLCIVPGGPGADAIAAHKSLYNLVYSMLHKGRTVATIGPGVKALLAAAAIKQSPNPIPTGTQILDGPLVAGRALTGPPELEEEIQKAEGHYLDRPVVVAGPVVTAQDVEGAQLERFVDTVLPIAQHYRSLMHTV